MNQCALCKMALDTEHPQSIRDVNPETFRMAWMHSDCLEVALDDLKHQPASTPEYENRWDEYVTRFA